MTKKSATSWFVLSIVMVPLVLTAALLWIPELRTQAEATLDRWVPTDWKTEIAQLRSGKPAPGGVEESEKFQVTDLLKKVEPSFAGAIFSGVGLAQTGPSVTVAIAIDTDGGHIAIRSGIRKGQIASLRRWSPPASVDAEVAGTDSVTGLVYLKSKTKTVPLSVGDTEPAFVLGGSLMAVTVGESGVQILRGIVSALGQGESSRVQTDIHPQSKDEGAAVFNADGQWMGLLLGNGTVLPRSEMAKYVSELKDRGTIRRPTLGLELQTVSGPLATRLLGKLPEGQKAALMVTSSEQPGISPYDLIIGRDDIMEFEKSLTVGDEVKFSILRNGKTEAVTVEVLDQNPPANEHPIEGLGVEWLGTASQTSESGRVRIQRVEPGSKFEKAGIVSGDVLLDVDRQLVRNLGQIQTLLKAKGSHTVRVKRPGWVLKPGMSSVAILLIQD